MSDKKNETTISLAEKFGCKVQKKTDGSLIVYTDHKVTVKPAKRRQIGDVMEDGTIYAGISPDTKKPMFAEPESWTYVTPHQAEDHARELKVGGSGGFRVPSEAEIKMLFKSREKGALKGTFNINRGPGNVFWMKRTEKDGLRWLDFETGKIVKGLNDCLDGSIRCVRG